jgi:hypothetical protein
MTLIQALQILALVICGAAAVAGILVAAWSWLSSPEPDTDQAATSSTGHHPRRDEPLSAVTRGRIANFAQKEARYDWAQFGKPRANPYRIGTHAHSCYALEYGRTWFDMTNEAPDARRA